MAIEQPCVKSLNLRISAPAYIMIMKLTLVGKAVLTWLLWLTVETLCVCFCAVRTVLIYPSISFGGPVLLSLQQLTQQSQNHQWASTALLHTFFWCVPSEIHMVHYYYYYYWLYLHSVFCESQLCTSIFMDFTNVTDWPHSPQRLCFLDVAKVTGRCNTLRKRPQE